MRKKTPMRAGGRKLTRGTSRTAAKTSAPRKTADSVLPRVEQAKRHPSSLAWERWRQAYQTIFAGPIDGVYLKNRIQLAFESGWFAAEKAVTEALDVR